MAFLRPARLVASLVAALALLAACNPVVAGPTNEPATGDRIGVVTTMTVLADLARQVGGERVEVHSLVASGADVHTFDPAPSDAARLAEARVVLMNGLGLDDWLRPLARDAGAADDSVVTLAEDLPGVEYVRKAGSTVNPHLWLDVALARRYVERISEALSAADPPGAEAYAANAAAYDARLADLDSSIRRQLAAVPTDARRVVSFHDAFPYFAAAYDLEIVGVVVEAPGQEPSAAEVAELIDAIREADARAILAEQQFTDDVARAIAAETGATVVHDLYTDSLGAAPLDTYEAAMRWNAEQIVEGLR